ncbi:hypothetical protein F511_15373 [Dorcoceras hygrometricum]|uniref:Uncharacterized protein n=1 Tax=Dorcoceras hygrometricum TaxID=472368 RepID=A0A2Z7C3V7_9LAMI|nr:hypothetical protein F511_15373 [Dorcoceras hygrometricum]
MAADDSLSTPFLATRPSDRHSYVVVDVNGCDRDESTCQNPFGFIGAHEGFEVPRSNTVDPFRNGTPGVEGVYEWLKIVICLPLAAVRLALFGLCLMVGYVATVLALHGWKDKQNPLPKWRCRVMWVTRLCARAILFSFGYAFSHCCSHL